MSRAEDPVAELGISVVDVTGPETLGPRVRVSWSPGPGPEQYVELAVSPSLSSRTDALVYDPTFADHPFEIVEGPVRGGDGRKIVALLVVSEDGLVVNTITAGSDPAGPDPEPATGHELELVAALADRFDDRTAILRDLALAGLVVRIEVSRLTVPLGSLVLEDGRFSWKEAAG